MLAKERNNHPLGEISSRLSQCTILLEGIVQGVGFRPFAYRLAKQKGLKGYIRNQEGALRIDVQGPHEDLHAFYKEILSSPPQQSRIYSSKILPLDAGDFSELKIVESGTKDQSTLLRFITPDLALCADCRKDLIRAEDRRHRYPFITCTHCGPRYSILESLPYDRVRTSMRTYTMCVPCQTEYENPDNRRFHSETNSCPDCGIHTSFYDFLKKRTLGNSFEEHLALAIDTLKNGGIVAVKGIGGYLLMADATNEHTVMELRKRKHRPTKPFAVLYPDLNSIEEDFSLSPQEERTLTGSVAPIVLLRKRENMGDSYPSGIAQSALAPGLSRMGVMLPYAPLLQLVINDIGRPLIATSANISGGSIIASEEEAHQKLSNLADAMLSHDRPILMPQDDSVICFTPRHSSPVILRLSRGMAPLFIDTPYEGPCLLGTGASSKSTLAIASHKGLHVSQYLGDTTDYDCQSRYKMVVEKLSSQLRANPSFIAHDLHPEYFGSIYAAQKVEPPYSFGVQHHEAHFAALLEEKKLWNSKEKILGVIWDGTGLGKNKEIWGGEFFSYSAGENFERVFYLESTSHFLGDKMTREPRLSALSYCHQIEQATPLLKHKFTDAEWRIYGQWLGKGNLLQNTSAGRLFDAVASLLGILDKQSYEGEAAMLLEEEAYRFPATLPQTPYPWRIQDKRIETRSILEGITTDLIQGESVPFIAYRFHLTLASMVGEIALLTGHSRLAFSGGVFQNTFLVDLIQDLWKDRLELHFHQKLSPNDENISLGQLAYVIQYNNKQQIKRKEELCV